MPEPIRRIECAGSAALVEWLVGSAGSVLLSTYQAGKLVVLGWDGRHVAMLPVEFEKPMGMAIEGDRLAIATRHEVICLSNSRSLAADFDESHRGRYDALFMPRVHYHTGDINTHDLGYTADGLIVCNTRFSCLARLSEVHNFEPVWKPPFITAIAPEDRCHLNGLAVVDGRATFVTALGASDQVGGWRETKRSGGIVIEVESGETIVGGLSMPHSPRWYDGTLWVLNSGHGELLRVDAASGETTVVCSLPGYLRGLTFVGEHALVGLCQVREKHIFGGLPVQERHPRLLCGLAVVDWRRGTQTAFLEFTTGVQEIFEVLFLPGSRNPMLTNTQDPAIRDGFTSPECAYWLRPSNLIE